MKDSGIEWIGEIPEEWEVRKLKYFSEILRGASPRPIDNPIYYDESGDYSWVRISDVTASDKYLLEAGDKLSDLGKSKTVCLEKNELFISICATVGKPCISKIKCCIHDGFVYLPKLDKEMNNYLYYIFEAGECYKGLGKLGTQLNLNTETIGNISIPFKSIDMCNAIADYLDKKCGEIDSVIKAKETTNEKLKEYRQSIIYEAVTKGLDKNVKMKDSGIEWIGEIPEDWETIKIKYTSTLKGRIGWQGLKADEFIEEGPHLITGVNFENEKINWDTCVHISNERFQEAPDIHVSEGDLLITKDGTVGKVAVAENCPNKVSLNSGVLLIKPQKENVYLNKFLLYILLSDVFWKWFKISQNGNSTIIHLYQEQFSNFIYPLPNIADEQQNIVNYLDKKCTEIDSVIKANEDTIEKLKQYRQSVIYEAVTGKVEVQ